MANTRSTAEKGQRGARRVVCGSERFSLAVQQPVNHAMHVVVEVPGLSRRHVELSISSNAGHLRIRLTPDDARAVADALRGAAAEVEC